VVKGACNGKRKREREGKGEMEREMVVGWRCTTLQVVAPHPGKSFSFQCPAYS
jgi:hypothetical protein